MPEAREMARALAYQLRQWRRSDDATAIEHLLDQCNSLGYLHCNISLTSHTINDSPLDPPEVTGVYKVYSVKMPLSEFGKWKWWNFHECQWETTPHMIDSFTRSYSTAQDVSAASENPLLCVIVENEQKIAKLVEYPPEAEATAPSWNLDGSRAADIPVSTLKNQVDGTHYKQMAIQPVEYCHKNGIDFLEGSVIKYVSRYKQKNGAKDLRKAIHFLQILLELEYGEKQ